MAAVTSLSDMSTARFVVAVAITAVVATGVFSHASRHGSPHATAWGVATFLFAGVAVPLYFIRYWLQKRSRRG